jgi:hypothetical protein
MGSHTLYRPYPHEQAEAKGEQLKIAGMAYRDAARPASGPYIGH